MDSRMKFADEMEFDTSGPLRIEERADRLYVVGTIASTGILVTVESREEGELIIAELQAKVGSGSGG